MKSNNTRYTSKNNKKTGELSKKELLTLFSRLSRLADWKAGFFIRILMEKHGYTALDLKRATGFSDTLIQRMADTKKLGGENDSSQ